MADCDATYLSPSDFYSESLSIRSFSTLSFMVSMAICSFQLVIGPMGGLVRYMVWLLLLIHWYLWWLLIEPGPSVVVLGLKCEYVFRWLFSFWQFLLLVSKSIELVPGNFLDWLQVRVICGTSSGISRLVISFSSLRAAGGVVAVRWATVVVIESGFGVDHDCRCRFVIVSFQRGFASFIMFQVDFLMQLSTELKHQVIRHKYDQLFYLLPDTEGQRLTFSTNC